MKAISLMQIPVQRAMLVRALAGLLGALAALAALPQKADAGVFIGVGMSVGVPPPPLPLYEQPPIPGAGYIWTPGYWAWDGNEYYWVPGTWVIAPFYGALWTPGYWGWDGAFYVFHPGYWGYRVGFYGGIDYGWGYPGAGYVGGYWGHGGFYYNRAVNRFGGVHIPHAYDRAVISNVSRTSYNGGRGGIAAHATPQEMAFARQARMGPIAAQQRQMNLASRDPAMRASFNHGAPSMAATQRPGVFRGTEMATAHGGGIAPATAGVRSMNDAVVHAPRNAAANNGMALRSAHFAPHEVGPATMRPSASYNYLRHPVASPASRSMQPMNTYRASPMHAPAYRPQQYRASPAPQYHAYHPASAPRSMGGAPHGGGGHDAHR